MLITPCFAIFAWSRYFVRPVSKRRWFKISVFWNISQQSFPDFYKDLEQNFSRKTEEKKNNWSTCNCKKLTSKFFSQFVSLVPYLVLLQVGWHQIWREIKNILKWHQEEQIKLYITSSKMFPSIKPPKSLKLLNDKESWS